MAPNLIADVMLFNLEVAQSFSHERNVPDTFYKSMLNSFTQLIQHVSIFEILPEFKDRIIKVYQATLDQKWEYAEGFTRALDIID
jgi:urate oxidase